MQILFLDNPRFLIIQSIYFYYRLTYNFRVQTFSVDLQFFHFYTKKSDGIHLQWSPN